jgi:hypothetical protein
MRRWSPALIVALFLTLTGCPEDECKRLKALMTWDGAETLHVVLRFESVSYGMFKCDEPSSPATSDEQAACLAKIKEVNGGDHIDLRSNGGANVVEHLERGASGLDLVVEADIPIRSAAADHIGVTPATTQVGKAKPVSALVVKVPDRGTVTADGKATRLTMYGQSATTGLVTLGKNSRKIELTKDTETAPTGIFTTFPGLEAELVSAGLLKK